MALRRPAELAKAEPKLVRFERAVNKGMVQQLLASAVQKFEDAKRVENSGPTRLEAAYDAMLFCSLALFAAHGYRVSSGQGHHQVALEGMAALLKLATAHYDEIEQIRETRNSKYTGFMRVSDADMKAALAQGIRVLRETEAWFRATRPELLR